MTISRAVDIVATVCQRQSKWNCVYIQCTCTNLCKEQPVVTPVPNLSLIMLLGSKAPLVLSGTSVLRASAASVAHCASALQFFLKRYE